MSEVRRVVLEHACTELDMLLREESYRAHAEPDKVPKDSAFKVGQGAAGRPGWHGCMG